MTEPTSSANHDPRATIHEQIESPDTARPERLPPGQRLTTRLPVLHEGDVPAFDPTSWDLAFFPVPILGELLRFGWAEFDALPKVTVHADMHCVTGWSHLDNFWHGVSTRGLLPRLKLTDAAKFVMVHCEGGYSTNLPLADFFAEDVLLATGRNGETLTPDHGFPVRLVVPRLYSWKSAKWVRGVEFLAEDRSGYWERAENGGYHMRGDPWAEERTKGESADF